MALRIRQDGRILCAAMHPAEPGDTYLHDGISYRLTVELGAVVTEPMECDGGRGGHSKHGEWWWRSEVPADVLAERSAHPPALDAEDRERLGRAADLIEKSRWPSDDVRDVIVALRRLASHQPESQQGDLELLARRLYGRIMRDRKVEERQWADLSEKQRQGWLEDARGLFAGFAPESQQEGRGQRLEAALAWAIGWIEHCSENPLEGEEPEDYEARLDALALLQGKRSPFETHAGRCISCGKETATGEIECERCAAAPALDLQGEEGRS